MTTSSAEIANDPLLVNSAASSIPMLAVDHEPFAPEFTRLTRPAINRPPEPDGNTKPPVTVTGLYADVDDDTGPVMVPPFTVREAMLNPPEPDTLMVPPLK